ncbi:hypothetical protein [uncultured Algoriphagus sp.]|uniref:poly(ethylene terephthalate) hydrolase family protein n=1 Tax=uncultured Algoriphagus sp. TaxID=417365 RepID=UPI0030EBB90B|tara:strand:+ start:5467 stop:7857 length:2391 start_codon:yes stop_codon:yes gene_type:complete
MKKSIKNTFLWIRSKILLITPGKSSTKGAAVGLIILIVSLVLINSILSAFQIGDPWYLLFGILTLLLAYLLGLLGAWLIVIISGIPRLYRVALIMSVPLLFLLVYGQLVLIVGLIIISSLLGAAFYIFRRSRFSSLKVPQRVISVLGLIIGLFGLGLAVYFYSLTGMEVDPIENAALLSTVKISAILGDSPAKLGTYKVKTITYGSGNDKHRPDFAEKVTYNFLTDSVNGVAFLDNWKDFSGWWREKYWGFDDKSLPINGRVWYPDGPGTFPLVLIVHGNHSMQDYSDPGYEYLGELLASRGMILVSVDENFINGSWTDIFKGLEKENDARAWLLLEHLKVWHKWNSKDDHPFYNKVDIDRIALIGHSRGGEAVAHAALLNELDYYPDDATIKLDYHYKIKSIIAIAPVDGQYESGDTRTKLKDINYFVIHGAQDADVSSYMGSMQYERITFEDTSYHFKSGLYVYGANHGQFNSSWGQNDTGSPFLGLLNLKQQLDEDAQQQIAKVYISAFLDATLLGKKQFLPLFVDARKGKNWLPETIYLSQFEDSKTKILADFEEDFDVETASLDSSFIQSEKLTVWREAEIQLKWDKKGSRASHIGWDYEVEDSLKEKKAIDVVADSLIASYSLNFNPSPFLLDSTSVLTFSMAESTEDSNPKSSGKWVADDDDSNNDNVEEKEKPEINNKEENGKEKKAKTPLDFSIYLIDSAGQSVKFLLSEFSPLQREIAVKIWKSDFIKGDSESENIFQTFYFNLGRFAKLNPSFRLSKLKTVKFVFDQSTSGVVLVDNIGFSSRLN